MLSHPKKTVPEGPPNLTLRERKNLMVCAHIQTAALDLFDARGYTNVSVDDVAEAAGVSVSTVYRHFGAKERLVTHDELDGALARAILAVDPSVPLLAATRQVFDQMRPALAQDAEAFERRVRYMIDEPAVHTAFIQETAALADYLAAQDQRRRGLVPPADPDGGATPPHVRLRLDDPEAVTRFLTAHTLVGAIVTAVHIWRGGDFTAELTDILDSCLDQLEGGLR
ncbi:MAG: TetR/AcrR family transcriptional regulator [Micrococcales bacterium]|nr:TetR/AcrR family transcriptional regulator [Micrococcales bacterium]